MSFITNEEAFRVRGNEVNIQLSLTGHDFKFTRNWFRQRNQVTWSTYLKPMFDTNSRIRAIQIGVFEFMDAAWLMQNVLVHPASCLVCIDPWAATTKLSAEYMEAVRGRAAHNAGKWVDEGKVSIMRGYSQDILPSLSPGYNLVVIDGDHNAEPVYKDAKEALRLLHPGGYIVFDDVRNRIPKKNHVFDGIEMFLKEHRDEVELQWQHRYADCYRKL